MSHVQKTGRPLTTKEARKQFNKRGGRPLTSAKDRQRLVRALERQEEHERKAKQEDARRESRKLKEQRDAEARAEHRRLGIPDPAVKIRQSQPRIAGFFQARAGKRKSITDDTDAEDSPDGKRARRDDSASSGDSSPASTQDFGSFNIEDFTDDSVSHGDSKTLDHQTLQPTSRSADASGQCTRSLDWDSYLATNSQIERELSCDESSANESASASSPRSHCTLRPETVEPVSASIAVHSDISLLINAIPSQEFRELTPEEEDITDISCFLNGLASQELDDYD